MGWADRVFGLKRSETRARVMLTTVLQVLVGLMAGRVFDRFVWIFPIVAALTCALIVVTRRGPTWARATGLIVFGIAAGAFASWWVGGSISGFSPFGGMRELLTSEWPSPLLPGPVVAIVWLLIVVGTAAMLLTLDDRWHLMPLVPTAVGATILTALSAPGGPLWVYWVVGAITGLAFAVIPHGTSVRTRTSEIAGEQPFVGAIALLGLTGMFAVLVAPGQDRADPRILDEPELSAPLLDPIEAVTAMRNAEPAVELYRIENQSKLASPALPAFWHLTIASEYDGQRWTPASTLRPIGGRLADPPDEADLNRPPLEYSVRFLTDRMDLVPYPGSPLEVSTSVNTDRARDAIQMRARPEPGDTILARSLAQPAREDVANAPIATRPVEEIPSAFTDVATRMAGQGTEIERLVSIETTMRDEWSLDPNTPGAGQQLALMERFLTETRRGTREQFATGFALLVRSLGFQSRVATGFEVPPELATTPIVLNSSQAQVWPEVLVEGVGWVRFDPTPLRPDDQSGPEPPLEQTQAAAPPQPPILPPNEQVDQSGDDEIAPDSPTDRFAALRRAIAQFAMIATIALLPIAVVLGTILGAKWERRRRRERHPDPATRVRGAWANTTDALVDAGLSIGVADTDRSIAEASRSLVPGAGISIETLSEMSTRVTFDRDADGAAMSEDAIDCSRSASSAIAEEMTRWQRLRWRLSLRSLRPKTRSPVVP